MFTPKIVPERVLNPRLRVYHVNFEISQSVIESFKRPLRETSEKYLKKVGERGTLLLREIFAIPGVTEVYIEPYELDVEKGYAFSWGEIEPAVMEALRRVISSLTPPSPTLQERMAKWFMKKVTLPAVSLRGRIAQKWSSLMTTIRGRLSRKK